MSRPNLDSGADDDRLAEAIAEYYRRLEQCPPVDRLLFVEQHPELAEELRSFFDDLDEVEQLAKTVPGQSAPHFSQGQPRTVHYFGDYELLSEVARGGMGVVYRARQVSLNRTVAVKMILAGRLASAEDVARFRREATGAAKLQHPNVVTIYEIGEHEGQHFFSMEYVEGCNLAQLVRNTSLSPLVAAEYARTIAHAIAAVHTVGLLHRDLKPSNVLLETRSGLLRITDFGLIKSTDLDTLCTDTGQVLGTPSYMAPEQAAGKNELVGPGTDIYSIGAILYELVTSKPPFIGDTPWHTAWKVQNAEVETPSSLNPKLPRDLETICLKCLQKEISRRYVSALELADDLGRFLRGEPIHARPFSRVERAWRWCRRNPALSLTGGAAAAGFVALLVVLAIFGIAQHKNAVQLAQALKESETRGREVNVQLAESYRDKGVRLCEQGEIDQGCIWLLRGLAAAPDNATDLRWSIRMSLGGWQRELFTPLPDQGPQPPPRGQQGGESGGIKQIISPDGQLIASWASREKGKELILSNRNTGKTIGQPHPGEVHYAAFSPDSRRLATGCRDSTTDKNQRAQVQLWDTATAEPVGSPVVHSDDKFSDVQRIVFAANGERLITASSQSIYVWDQDGKKLAGPLRCKSARKLLAASDNGKFLVFDVETRQTVRRGNTWSSPSPDCRLWDVEAQRAVGPTLGEVRIAAFSPDGRMLATGYHQSVEANKENAKIQLWNTATGEKVGPTLVHNADRDSGSIADLTFSADGQRLFSVSRETLYVWTRNGEGIAGPLACRAGKVSPSADGRLVMYRGSGGDMRLWDVDTQQIVGQPLEGTAAEISSDGRTVFTSDKRWAVPERGLLAAPQIHSSKYAGILWITFSQDSRYVLTSGFYDASARLWNARNGAPIGQPLDAPMAIRGRGVSPSGDWFVVGGEVNPALPPGSELVFWEPRGATKQARHLPTHSYKQVDSLALSADGKWLATAGSAQGGKSAEIFLYDVENDKVAAGPWSHPKVIEEYAIELQFAPDGESIVSHESYQETAILWRRETGQPIGEPLRQERGIKRFAFSPDSRTLVAIGEKKISFWDVDTGKPRALSLSHQDDIIDLTFSPDSKSLATVHQDRSARIWDAQTGNSAGPPIQHAEVPLQARFALEGKLLVTGTEHAAYLWEPLSGTPVGPPLRPCKHLEVSPDGQTIAIVSGEELRLWDVPRPLPDDVASLTRQLEASTGLSVKLAPILEGASASESAPENKQ